MFDLTKWTEGSVIGISNHPKIVIPVFINTHTGDGVKQWPVDTWNIVDLSNNLSLDAKAVMLSTLLIITHGGASEIADLWFAIRRHGEQYDNHGNYHAQAVCNEISGGIRQPDFIIVPLKDGKFEFYWHHTPAVGIWPEYSAYCINMGVCGYIR